MLMRVSLLVASMVVGDSSGTGIASREETADNCGGAPSSGGDGSASPTLGASVALERSSETGGGSELLSGCSVPTIEVGVCLPVFARRPRIIDLSSRFLPSAGLLLLSL